MKVTSRVCRGWLAQSKNIQPQMRLRKDTPPVGAGRVMSVICSSGVWWLA